MKRRTAQFRIETPCVARLRDWLEEKRFAVPQLQREFVWNGKKAAKLFDSIHRGLTIGSLLVWETSSDNSGWLRQELNLLPAFNKANDQVWYLIDGQQRLTVLYQAARGETKKNSNGTEVKFRNITFALVPYEKDEDHFAYRHEVDGRYVSVADILAHNWRHLFRRYGKVKKEKIRRCRETLLRYPVPVQFITTKNIEDVRATFLRINSGGTRVNAADEAFARASNFNLRHHVHVLRASLPGCEDIDPNAILQGFGFVCGRHDVGKQVTQAVVKDWEDRISKDCGRRDEFDAAWNKYSEVVQKAVNLLRNEFCVYNLDFLPSENMLAILPFFYSRNGAQPSLAQRRELRKWFWATAVGNRYSGRGHRKNMVADIDFLEKLAKHQYSRFPSFEKAAVSDLVRTQYSTNTSLGRGFFCLLASHKPRMLFTEAAISVDIVAGRADKKNKHHIFPKDLLTRHGIPVGDYNSISNICFLCAQSNQTIGNQPPRVYLGALRRKYGFKGKMSSHLIPYIAGAGIWLHDVKKAFHQFRRERATEVRKAFKQAAGVDLFRDDR